MSELLPESWRVEALKSGCCHSKRPRRELVVDFALWTECYAILSAVLSVRYPTKAPHFSAYLRIITNASRNFEGSAWASYDMAFRRQAANRKSLDWGRVNHDLYSQAFTGRARLAPRCRYCLAQTHASADCTYAPAGSPSSRPTHLHPSRPAATSTPSFRQLAGRSQAQTTVEICRLYNQLSGSQCRFMSCRFAHVCSRCHRSHPASECDRRQPPTSTLQPSSASAPAATRP